MQYHIFFANFVAIPFRSSSSEGHFDKKVLLKLSSLMKFSQNFLAVKMVAIASHLWFVQPVVGSYISIGVGYCFIQQQRQCEKPHQLDKAISSHTLFFIRYLLGIG